MKELKIEKSKYPEYGKWIVWGYCNIGKGYNYIKLFKGTKKECKEFLQDYEKRKI